MTMSGPARHRRGVARWRTLVLVAVAAALLAGCDLATGTVRTATELEEAGIRNPNLNYERETATATLEFDADPNPLEARAEQDRAAAVIWRNLPFRIDAIAVTPDGVGLPSREYPRALLEQQLGPRPAGLDRSVDDIARRAIWIAVAVALVVLVLIIVVVVLVVRAVRRRPTPQPAGHWPQAGTPQPWGQPGPQQQGWGQPPPAQPQPWGAQPPEAVPPSRGPGGTQRLEPEPPPPPEGEQRGPTPPA
jgi:hypothetical protein